MKEILILAAVTSVASWIITMMEVFRNFREAIDKWAKKNPTEFRKKLAYLPTCPFCTSAYVSAFFLVLAPTKLVAPHFGGYIIAWFFVQSIAYVMLTAYHHSRVWLRWGQALANTQEAIHARIKIGAETTEQHATLEEKTPEYHRPMTIPFPGLAKRTVALSPRGHD